MLKNYVDCRNWLESFIPQVYGKEELGLKRIENLLKLLGDPQKKFKSIHVAGTSGKGSTAYYISRLVKYSEKSEGQKYRKIRGSDNLNIRQSEYSEFFGIKIGLHISPHLVDIRERMQINGQMIPMRRFVGLVHEIKPVVDAIKSKQVEKTPSYFEILVALTFLYFAQEKVDWAVVEVGLGGRLDATNVLQPQVAVITNVGLDHTEILGKTIEKIAQEKAGIIKGTKQKARLLSLSKARSKAWLLTDSLVVTGATGKALDVIKKVARLASASLIVLNSESKRAKAKNATLITLDTRQDLKIPKSDVFGYIKRYYYSLRATGSSFVSQNKNLALLTVLSLGVKLDAKTVKKAFTVGFPGRFEGIDEGVVVDGAHNADKMKALIRWVKSSQFTVHSSQKIVLVIAFKTGKNWRRMVDLLINNLPVKKVVVTEYRSVTDTGLGSAVNAREIAQHLSNDKRPASSAKRGELTTKIIKNSQEAVFEAINLSWITPGVKSGRIPKNTQGVSPDLVLVTGSLYLVGEARTLWQLPDF